MADDLELKVPELRLLFACARIRLSHEEETVIRVLLEHSIDWTRFVRKAVEHGLASLVAHTLVRVAPDKVPGDILDAMGMIVDQTRRRNQALFEELAGILEALATKGIEAIPFKGPILAIQAFGDLGLRAFRDLDFLIHDPDIAATVATLRDFGFERQGRLSEAQYELIHRLQGQEIVFKQSLGSSAEPHTRLTPAKMALDIDYAGLWQRARRSTINGHSMLTLAPEDDLVILSIHGGKEMWWNIKWACDVAAYIASHGDLDWKSVAERAQAQGCLRMVLLATALARRYFASHVPNFIVAAQAADPAIAPMMGRIASHWQADEAIGPPSNRILSMDRLRLHDGPVRQARYIARTLLIPGPHHVAILPLPGAMSFVYGPIAILHDTIVLPVWQATRYLLRHARRKQDVAVEPELMRARKLNSEPPMLVDDIERRAHGIAEKPLAGPLYEAKSERKHARALVDLKRYNDAVASFKKVLVLAPEDARSWRDCGAALLSLGLKDEAIDYLDKALELDSSDARAWTVRARALSEIMRFSEAIESCRNALAIDPSSTAASRIAIHSQLFSCDWHNRNEFKRTIAEAVEINKLIITPFDYRSMSDSEAVSLTLAQIWAKQFSPSSNALWRGEIYRHDKLRIAYISSDFRDHVVADSVIGCIEHHDRARFETTAISLGPDDGSDMRRRLAAAFHRFVDAQTVDDFEVAKLMRKLEIDIAIDLNGYAGARRSGILAHRPAPVQVNYLGYPGTMGSPNYDYVVADRIVIPHEHQQYYSEKIACLPETCFVADGTRAISLRPPSRNEVGLPERGFVFACHNPSYKIAPEIFDVWMAILRAVEGSVLWLRATNTSAIANLRQAARIRGVEPERLLFATRVPHKSDHLARLGLADLFLDTQPFGGPGNASDALWAGLPVLTCQGGTFAGRITASELYAIGLAELATPSLAEYEALAIALARNPGQLGAIKAKLVRNRESAPLFDTARFTRNLERAYLLMRKRQQSGLAPEHLSVEPAEVLPG